jgi:hypothetical protein
MTQEPQIAPGQQSPEPPPAAKPVEGPVIDGVHNLIAWADATVKRVEARAADAKATIIQRVDAVEANVHRIYTEVRVGFWITVILLILYSPPVKALFTRSEK